MNNQEFESLQAELAAARQRYIRAADAVRLCCCLDASAGADEIEKAIKRLSIRAIKTVRRLVNPNADRWNRTRFAGACLLSQLEGISDQDLLELKNCGHATAREILLALKDAGVRLGVVTIAMESLPSDNGAPDALAR